MCVIENAEIDFQTERLDLSLVGGEVLDRQANTVVFKSSTLVTIPVDILSDLPELETINADKCDITLLREYVFGVNSTEQLKKLEHLHLSNNSMTWLENGTFAGAKQLKTLKVSNNHLTLIDRLAFQGLEKLQKLDLSNNHLTVLEWSWFSDMKELCSLLIHHNRIVSIDAISNTPTLKILNLAHNELTEVEELKQLTSLTELDLSWNVQLQMNITSLLTSLPDLQKLHLSKLTRVDLNIDNFPVLAKLEALFVDHNHLHTIEGYKVINNKFPQLKDIDISHNLFTCSFLQLLLDELRAWGIMLRRKDKIFDDNQIEGIWCKDVATWDAVDDNDEYVDNTLVHEHMEELSSLVNGMRSLLKFYGWYFTAIGVILLVLIIAVMVNCLFNLQPAIIAKRKRRATLIELLPDSDHGRN
jgi:hypothetical protein